MSAVSFGSDATPDSPIQANSRRSSDHDWSPGHDYGSVSGHSKPATRGEMKTSHFERRRLRRRGASTRTWLTEAVYGESTFDGGYSLDPTALFDALVPAADRPRAGDRPGDGAEVPGVRVVRPKTRHFALRLGGFKTSHFSGLPGSGRGANSVVRALTILRAGQNQPFRPPAPTRIRARHPRQIPLLRPSSKAVLRRRRPPFPVIGRARRPAGRATVRPTTNSSRRSLRRG